MVNFSYWSSELTQSRQVTKGIISVRCKQPNCGGLARPHVVWFGESLDRGVLNATNAALEKCDMCLLVQKLIIFPLVLLVNNLVVSVESNSVSYKIIIIVSNYFSTFEVVLTSPLSKLVHRL